MILLLVYESLHDELVGDSIMFKLLKGMKVACLSINHQNESVWDSNHMLPHRLEQADQSLALPRGVQIEAGLSRTATDFSLSATP